MSKESSKGFGQWLRGLRAELRQTQEEVATAVGCSPHLIASWEKEERLPAKVVSVVAIAKWSGLSGTEVFEIVSGSIDERA